MSSKQNKKAKPSEKPAVIRREDSIRISDNVAGRVREGHPWIFQNALLGRKVNSPSGTVLDVLDSGGKFVARALCDLDDQITLRVFSRRSRVLLDSKHFAMVVARAARLRRNMLDLGPLSCFRGLSGDSEGVPAVNVDHYGPYIVVCIYSQVAEKYLDQFLDAYEEVWNPEGVYLQRRFLSPPSGRARPGAELIRGKTAPTEIVVAEGRTRFVVDVTAPLGTGLFADMRLGRSVVARLAPGRRVLNCFSYAGAFSIVAAIHGANSVLSIDSSARAHGWARRNFLENGIATQDRAYSFEVGDVFAVLTQLAEKNEKFDLLILDPPSFSGGKTRPFSAVGDYAELVKTGLTVLEHDGVLFAASNMAKLPAQDLERALGQGARAVRRDLLISERIGQPPDFPVSPGFAEGNYLKAFVAWVD
ncbi:MAG: class I SAM-dependent rRNA methyltransferase [Pseudomonadota bacterium]